MEGIKRGIYIRGKRRKLKKSVRKTIILVLSGLLILSLVPLIIHVYDNFRSVPRSVRVHYYDDKNAVHLRYAQARGITPLTSEKNFREKIENLVKNKKLVKISDNKFYVVKKLTHSHPYLVPEAAKLLELIGKRFQQKLTDKNTGKYLFRVSSVLRTLESQKSLRGSNGNATSNSSHYYGTTFDITYKNLARRSILGKSKVVTDPVAIKLLSETIGDLRRENRLVVVTEKNEACFHITLR